MSDDSRHKQLPRNRAAGHRWASFKPELPLIELTAGFSVAAEQFRKLALRVEQAAGVSKGRGYVVVLSSPDAEAGKTTTSLNLALAAARRGEKRVLVIESDLWKPKYESMLIMSSTPMGLSDLLLAENRPPLSESVVSIWSTGLDLLVGGGSTRNGDLATSPRMADLVEEARSNYDLVVLDSPPYSLASGRALVEISDSVLIVVRSKRTRKRDIEQMLKEVGPEKTLGLVLNDVKGAKGHYSNYEAYDSYSNRSQR